MAVSAWRSGNRITAARLDLMLPRWSAWTPTWSTSTGASTPSFGNASVDCKYAQAGDVVDYDIEIIFGSTTNFGGGTTSDNWRFSLPVTASETQLIAGFGEIQGSGSGERFPVRGRIDTTTTLALELAGGDYGNITGNSSGLVDAATPFGASSTGSTAWGTNFAIRLQGHYQAA